MALKDALKATFFATIDELLLHVYYIYHKSPKKCRELLEVVDELKACLDPSEMPHQGGSRPLRACGTRFIAHKTAAFGRLINRFSAYLSHLVVLTEDASIKSVDRQKIKGYTQKWQDSKVLIGCAFFYDLLKAPANLCKVLQEDGLSVIRVMEAVMKTVKSLDQIKSTCFEELPTVKLVLARLQEAEGSIIYQGQEFKRYKQEGLEYVKANFTLWVDAVQSCIQKRIKTGETELLSHAVTLLATHGWERSESSSFGHPALEAVC